METEGSWMGVIDRELCVQRGERERRVQKCKKDVLFFFVLFCFPPRLVWAFWEAYGLPAQEPPCVVILPATCCWLFWLLSAPQIQSFRSNKNIY